MHSYVDDRNLDIRLSFLRDRTVDRRSGDQDDRKAKQNRSRTPERRVDESHSAVSEATAVAPGSSWIATTRSPSETNPCPTVTNVVMWGSPASQIPSAVEAATLALTNTTRPSSSRILTPTLPSSSSDSSAGETR